jgi:hypothetical protein
VVVVVATVKLVSGDECTKGYISYDLGLLADMQRNNIAGVCGLTAAVLVALLTAGLQSSFPDDARRSGLAAFAATRERVALRIAALENRIVQFPATAEVQRLDWAAEVLLPTHVAETLYLRSRVNELNNDVWMSYVTRGGNATLHDYAPAFEWVRQHDSALALGWNAPHVLPTMAQWDLHDTDTSMTAQHGRREDELQRFAALDNEDAREALRVNTVQRFGRRRLSFAYHSHEGLMLRVAAALENQPLVVDMALTTTCLWKWFNYCVVSHA